uniref:Uncharacterized protein n=1 Tax=Trichogramma kaykai TaxID=54128 RepID=A0ABD2XBU3_9HYME
MCVCVRQNTYTKERKRCAQGNFRVGFITTKERRKWRRSTGEEREKRKKGYLWRLFREINYTSGNVHCTKLSEVR